MKRIVVLGLTLILGSSPIIENLVFTTVAQAQVGGVLKKKSKKNKNKKSTKAKQKGKAKNSLKDDGLTALGGIDITSSNNKKKIKKNSIKKSKTKSIGILSSESKIPTLGEISEFGPEDYFWEPGLIDGMLSGDPDPDQCNQFFAGQVSGQSGGLSACFMASNVSFAFQPIFEAGTSSCYMRNFPTQANLDAGAVALVSGTFPDGDVEKIFATGEQSRLIKVIITGEQDNEGDQEGGPETIFIEVPSRTANDSKGLLYGVNLYFCGDDSDPNGLERLEITKSLKLTQHSIGNYGDSKHEALVEAGLTYLGGDVVVDPTIKRAARVSFAQGSSVFKGEIEITANNLLKVKTFDENGQSDVRKAYSISEIGGNDIESLVFKRGAFKDITTFGNEGDSFEGATSYNGSFYEIDKKSNLKSQLNSVNLNSDEFYQSLEEPEPDLSEFSCASSQPDIVVSIDMSNSAMQEVAQLCEAGLDNSNFCRSETIELAEQSFFDNCQGGGDH